MNSLLTIAAVLLILVVGWIGGRWADRKIEAWARRQGDPLEICRREGCDMQHAGGMNAECDRNCGCSVPVYVCTRCGDSDYGDNEEARAVKERCAAEMEDL